MKYPIEKYHRFDSVGLLEVNDNHIDIKYYGYHDSWLIRNLYTNNISYKDLSILEKIYKKEIRHQI